MRTLVGILFLALAAMAAAAFFRTPDEPERRYGEPRLHGASVDPDGQTGSCSELFASAQQVVVDTTRLRGTIEPDLSGLGAAGVVDVIGALASCGDDPAQLDPMLRPVGLRGAELCREHREVIDGLLDARVQFASIAAELGRRGCEGGSL